MATAWVERRLVAILAADVVGYSHLVEMDEAGTLAALKALRREVIDPLLAEHHGRIVKLMGDGALAEFGSVVDAVACAVAVQKGVADRQAGVPPERRIVFRIGINLGDVVVEGDDLLGDGVNIAARLEQICEPGGVMISGTAYDHLQGKLDLPLEFAGEQRLKNIDRPIRTYRIRLDGARAAPPAAQAPLGGRCASAAAVLLILGLGTGALVLVGRRQAGHLSAPCHRGPAVHDHGRGRGDEPSGQRFDRRHHHRSRPPEQLRCDRPRLDRSLQGATHRRAADRARPGRALRPGRLDPA